MCQGSYFHKKSFKTFVLDRSDNDRWWYESDEMTWEWEYWHFTTTILKFILMFTSDNFSLSLSLHDIRDWSRWWENFIQFFLAFSLPGTLSESLAIFELFARGWRLLLFPGNMINISMKPHKLDLGPYQFSCEPYNKCCIGMWNVKLLKKQYLL